jgi:ribose transport system ATP-binding protein
MYGKWQEVLALRGQGSSPVGSLSGGNQQKVILARALASGASLLLLDDPLRGVDVTTKQDVYKLLRAEADKGMSCLWYSTETEGLQECDRVLVMRSGRIAIELSPDDVSESALIRASLDDA